MRKETLQKLGAAGLIASLAGWFLLARIEVQAAPTAGKVTGQVQLTKDGEPGKDLSNIVVYLSGVPDALPDTSNMVFEVRQKNKQFTPSLLVALKGSTVEFPNDDKIFHNVFSLSRTSRFDLGLYKSGASKSVKMRRSGVVDVYCNIHPQMVSKILVLDTKYHAVTDKHGRFSIDRVPNGEYTLVGWQRFGEEYRGRVVVEAGKVTHVDVVLKRGDENNRHKRKDGTPYGRYE